MVAFFTLKKTVISALNQRVRQNPPADARWMYHHQYSASIVIVVLFVSQRPGGLLSSERSYCNQQIITPPPIYHDSMGPGMEAFGIADFI